MTPRHPSTESWAIPDARPPRADGLPRTNLRALAARPGRFEHHLIIVARVGAAQLEMATASEPLSFAHRNFTDELVVALPTGDAMLDAFPFRVFVGDGERDLARVNHRAGELVLHPEGFVHWPGRLRPPFDPPAFPGGMRRAVLSAIVCGGPGAGGAAPRPTVVAPGREADVKIYGEPAPTLGLDTLHGEPRELGRIGDTRLALARDVFAPPRGGYALFLEDAGDALATDLIYVAPGATLRLEGRALVLASDEDDASPPPRVWERVPDAPFAPFEDAPPGALPLSVGELVLHPLDDRELEVTLGGTLSRVPRHWLARLLYRVALHTLVADGARVDTPAAAFGHVETYGGFFYDDHGGGHRLGLRDAGAVDVPPSRLAATLERLYRAAAPPGYVERI